MISGSALHEPYLGGEKTNTCLKRPANDHSTMEGVARIIPFGRPGLRAVLPPPAIAADGGGGASHDVGVYTRCSYISLYEKILII